MSSEQQTQLFLALAVKLVMREGVIQMSTPTVRGIDEETRARLRVRAAAHGRSMEAEVRATLREVLARPVPVNGLGTRLHARFATVGGADLELPERSDTPRMAAFEQ